jgi:hypothetical protein
VGWQGDIDRQMGRLGDHIADLARIPSRVAPIVAEKLAEELDAEFSAGVDPYGRAWAPLAASTEARGRTPPPLTDSHAMRDGVRVAPLRGAGVGITVPHPGLPHQTGWSGEQGDGPARPILPAGSELPDAWEDVIFDACVEAFEK